MHRARTRAVLGVRHSFVLPIISDLRRSQVKSHMSSLHIGERSLFGLVFPGQTWNSKKWRP